MTRGRSRVNGALRRRRFPRYEMPGSQRRTLLDEARRRAARAERWEARLDDHDPAPRRRPTSEGNRRKVAAAPDLPPTACAAIELPPATNPATNPANPANLPTNLPANLPPSPAAVAVATGALRSSVVRIASRAISERAVATPTLRAESLIARLLGEDPLPDPFHESEDPATLLAAEDHTTLCWPKHHEVGGADGVQACWDGLRRSARLQRLHRLVLQDATSFRDLLRRGPLHPMLDTLVAAEIQLTDIDAHLLAGQLEFHSLSDIDVSWNRLTEDGIAAVCAAAPTRLNVSFNADAAPTPAAAALANMLARRSTRVLRAAGAGFGPAHARQLADALMAPAAPSPTGIPSIVPPLLQCLDLSCNSLGTVGISALSDAIGAVGPRGSFAVLEELVLDSTRPGFRGIEALAAALFRMGDARDGKHPLNMLSLRGNDVGGAGAGCLARGLVPMRRLSMLHLDENRISVAGDGVVDFSQTPPHFEAIVLSQDRAAADSQEDSPNLLGRKVFLRWLAKSAVATCTMCENGFTLPTSTRLRACVRKRRKLQRDASLSAAGGTPVFPALDIITV